MHKSSPQRVNLSSDTRIAELLRYRRHATYRRVVGQRLAIGDGFMRLRSLVHFIGDLRRLVREKKQHGSVRMSEVRKLLEPRTLERYLADLLDISDEDGGKEFYLFDDVLYMPHYHPSTESMAKAEAAYELAKLKNTQSKARGRGKSLAPCETPTVVRHLRAAYGPDPEMSPPCNVSVKKIPKTPYGGRSANQEHQGEGLEVYVAKGFRPYMVTKHGITVEELERADAKLAKTSLVFNNYGGALVATCLKLRPSGAWAA